MIVPDRVLVVASEVDLCPGNTYRAVHQMSDHADADVYHDGVPIAYPN
ncbi:hypothetical protein [Nocardia sp. NPDC047654]